MFIHHTFKSHVNVKKNAQKTMSLDVSQVFQPSTEKSKHRQKIQELLQNFTSISSTLQVNKARNPFNLIEYQKQDQKIKYDPQIMTAKLRRLQNQAEINRIQSQLEQRRKKKFRSYTHHFKQTNEFQNSTYQQTYKSFLENSKLVEMPQNQSQSDSDDAEEPKPKGIARFHQLKKHSKILQYTMKKLQEKEQQMDKDQREFQQRKQSIKKVTNNLKDHGEFKQFNLASKRTSSKTIKRPQVNPQTIIQDKYKRIMTMKANDKITEKVKSNPRCSKMINVQNDILLELQDDKKNLSKENMKKLKSRFVEIVNQLHKGDKKRKENKFLPSIQTVIFAIQQTARPVSKKITAIRMSKTINVNEKRKASRLAHYSNVKSKKGNNLD